MVAKKFLDETGVTWLISKIKTSLKDIAVENEAVETTANTANETATAAQTTATEAKAATDNLDTLIRATTDGVEVARIDSEGAYTGMRTEQTADAYLIKDKDGNTLASYGADTVELGVGNETAVIDMCDSATKITARRVTPSEDNGTEPYVESSVLFPSGYGKVGSNLFSGGKGELALIDFTSSELTTGIWLGARIDNDAGTGFANLSLDTAPGMSRIEMSAKWLELGTGLAQELGTDYKMSDVITALDLLTNYPNAGNHNSIYRGKYLGSSVTDAQYAEIAAGTFKDLYIGDYWTINSVNYRIAAFDYFYNKGIVVCTTHHVVLVPDATMYNSVMYSTRNISGGYVGSYMYKTGLASAKTTISNAFSGHVMTYNEVLTNSYTSETSMGYAWYDSTVVLMTSRMVFGGQVGYNGMTCGDTILPLFALAPQYVPSSDRNLYWLQDCTYNNDFAAVHGTGSLMQNGCTYSQGVRPYFCIYGG